MRIDEKRLEELQANMNVFFWMSKALDYPDEALVEEVLSNPLVENLPQERYQAFKDYIASFDSTAALLVDLQKEYTRMCHVSRPRLVPLFESVYKEGKLFQDSTFQIARLYHEAGLRPGSEFKLPPDHIALELEFMSYLIYQEMEAIKSGNRDNEEPVLVAARGNHVPAFNHLGLSVAKRLAEHAQTRFTNVWVICGRLFEPEKQPDKN